jgi:predicted DNA-binding protein (UPF0251 family)
MSRLAQVALGLDERMGVSRGTVQRLLQSGRSKVVGALLDSSALVIEQGASDASLRTDDG